MLTTSVLLSEIDRKISCFFFSFVTLILIWSKKRKKKSDLLVVSNVKIEKNVFFSINYFIFAN